MLLSVNGSRLQCMAGRRQLWWVRRDPSAGIGRPWRGL